MVSIAHRLRPGAAGMIRGLHYAYESEDTTPTIVDHTRTIQYVGVSDMSVVLEFNDGSRIRIINPDFLKGLKIEVHNKEDK